MKQLATLLIGMLAGLNVMAQHVTDLSGEWEFEIDREDVGKTENWSGRALRDRILLPGSMPQRMKGDDISVETKWIGSLYDSSYFYNPYLKKYREPGNMKLTFFLTPDKHYVGVAWYGKTVSLGKVDSKRHRYTVYLERPHIQSTLYVNGQEVGTDRSLCVPHEYDVTDYVRSGENRLSIRIDNRLETVNVGQDSHSVTDQTQGDWNGIVGRMELREEPTLHISKVEVFPDVDHKKAVAKVKIEGSGKKIRLLLVAASFNGPADHRLMSTSEVGRIDDGATVEVELRMGEQMQLWDEFHPNLYRLYAFLVEGNDKLPKEARRLLSDLSSDKLEELLHDRQAHETVFGMRKFEIRGRMFYVNGSETQLRGTVENCDFPLTGYAPMDLESWLKVFKQCKRYGLNHMRFHSYCPPEAAFLAADITGFYIQPEGPSWPNHGVKLGYGQDIDTYLMEETQRLNQVYGNHPSFCMLACGNEPAGRWVEWVSRFVDYWKEADPRHVYTGASVGGGWAWQPKSQYHVKAGARGLAWDKRAPQTMDDFSKNIARYSAKDMTVEIQEPYISHETGQWCVFPNFDEIGKYTGVNKAKNFEVFKDILRDHGMEMMARKFFMASGKLQTLCYKYDIERLMRTKDYAGFQLLGLNDYSGQGTALIGVTDVFFDEKDYCSSDYWREFCSPVVLLAKIPKFTYKNNETFKADILINQFSDKALEEADIRYSITEILHESEFQYDIPSVETVNSVSPQKKTISRRTYPIGGCQKVGTVEVDLSPYKHPTRIELTVEVAGTDCKNSWNIWVYPADVTSEAGNVLITDTLDAEALNVLAAGGKVLITAGRNVKYGNDVVQQFTPVFWNTSWFKMRPPHTTGLYVNNGHKALNGFPTSYHSDLQWWELTNKAPVMQFDEFPTDFQPIVQSIDTWFLSRKIGMLFEANVNGGRLMMTTMDITHDLDHRIVARQMRKSILDYMNSADFKPRHEIPASVVGDLFTKEAPKVNMFTNDSPDELKPKMK